MGWLWEMWPMWKVLLFGACMYILGMICMIWED
jgi:hypothetical protein